MPDLTIENRTVCQTNTSFEASVRGSNRGSKGIDYQVSYGWSQTSDVQYDWTCTCSAFKFGKKPCKHIMAVKPTRCGWNADLSDNGSYDLCPECGGPVEVVRIAV